VVNSMPWLLYAQKRPGTHCIGGWVGPRKISPPSRFDPQTIQPVASRYTDLAIPALLFIIYRVIQEESAILWKMIVCVILSKKSSYEHGSDFEQLPRLW
jgi:hypothetical protein